MATNELLERLEVAGEQYKTEITAADAIQTAVVYFEETLSSVFYFNPDDVYQDDKDGRFKLKSGAKAPEGLMSAEEMNNPDQLSAVLARVKSLEKMLENGVPITVLVVNKKHSRTDDPKASVKVEKGSLLDRYKNRTTVKKINEKLFNAYKGIIPAASYVWREVAGPGGLRLAAIFASPVSVPYSTAKSNILHYRDAYRHIRKLDSLLNILNVPSTFVMLFTKPPLHVRKVPSRKPGGPELL